MTLRNLAHILLSSRDLEKDIKISYRGGLEDEITSVEINDNGDLVLGVSGYNEDKVTVTTETIVKSPYSGEPKIF